MGGSLGWSLSTVIRSVISWIRLKLGACLDIEELYNKAEVHSINTSKGDAADVGIFSDNSQAKITV